MEEMKEMFKEIQFNHVRQFSFAWFCCVFFKLLVPISFLYVTVVAFALVLWV